MRATKELSGTSEFEKNEDKEKNKKGIFNVDGSLDAPFLRVWEKLKVFCSHMSGYLIETIRDIEDLRGAVQTF